MAQQAIVDTHVHLWDPKRLRYPWHASVPQLNRPYLPKDFREACGPLRVEKIVFLQCECDPSQYRDEVKFVTELAKEESRLAGMVPWAPLEKGEAARAELQDLAKNKLVKGVRRILDWPDPARCLHPDFIRGVQMLAEFGFTFDICLKGDEVLKNAVELVRRCPGVKFVLDHIGKPFIKEKITEPWKTRIRELSRLPNVWCKISGVVTEADHARWTPADLQPYLDHVVQCFGFDRVMYGSDWSVSTLATDLPRWVATLERGVAGTSASDLKKLFHDNAIAFYRL